MYKKPLKKPGDMFGALESLEEAFELSRIMQRISKLQLDDKKQECSKKRPIEPSMRNKENATQDNTPPSYREQSPTRKTLIVPRAPKKDMTQKPRLMPVQAPQVAPDAPRKSKRPR